MAATTAAATTTTTETTTKAATATTTATSAATITATETSCLAQPYFVRKMVPQQLVYNHFTANPIVPQLLLAHSTC